MALPVITAIGRVAKAGYDAYKMRKKVNKVKKLMKEGDASAYSAANRDARHKLLSKKKYQNKKMTRTEGKRLGLNSSAKKKYKTEGERLGLNSAGKRKKSLPKMTKQRDPKKASAANAVKNSAEGAASTYTGQKLAETKFKKQMRDFKEWSKTAITKAKKEKK